MPWTWARHRLANVVDSYLGQLGPSLDEAAELHLAAEPVPTGGIDESDVTELLVRLARSGSAAGERHVQVADLRVALEAVASERDRRVYLEVELQHALHDPSPANTVAAMYGLTPAAVRQVRCRVRRNLIRYAQDRPESGLADLALVA